MKRVLGALAVLALSARGGELRFTAAPGTETTLRWSETLTLEVDGLEETLGGNPLHVTFDQIGFATRRAFECSDRFARCGDGRPLEFTRRFASSELAARFELDGRPIGHVSGTHACDESVVRFAYEADEERYGRERVEGELDDELLEALEPDLELLALLPEGELEVGASFELEPEALRAFFAAGGGLGFRTSERKAEEEGVPDEVLAAGVLGSFHELFGLLGELSGTVEGKLAARDEDEEGALLARLEYELDVEARADLGARVRALLGSGPAGRALGVAGALEGRLVVLWDETAGRLRSARFEGDASLEGHVVFPLVLLEGGAPLEFVGDYELSGEARVELASE